VINIARKLTRGAAPNYLRYLADVDHLFFKACKKFPPGKIYIALIAYYLNVESVGILIARLINLYCALMSRNHRFQPKRKAWTVEFCRTLCVLPWSNGFVLVSKISVWIHIQSGGLLGSSSSDLNGISMELWI